MVPSSGQKGQNTSIPDCIESGRFFTVVQSNPDLIDFEQMGRGDSTSPWEKTRWQKQEENYKMNLSVELTINTLNYSVIPAQKMDWKWGKKAQVSA